MLPVLPEKFHPFFLWDGWSLLRAQGVAALQCLPSLLAHFSQRDFAGYRDENCYLCLFFLGCTGLQSTPGTPEPTPGCQRGWGGPAGQIWGGLWAVGALHRELLPSSGLRMERRLEFHTDAWEGRGGAEDVPSHGMEGAPDKGSRRQSRRNPGAGEILLCPILLLRRSHCPAPGPGVVGGGSSP